MRGTIILSFLLFAGFLVWRITEQLSADALGLATGVILGILAGLPVALLLMAASRRREPDDLADEGNHRRLGRHAPHQPAFQQPQPPVIILSGMPQGQAVGQHGGYSNGFSPHQRALPGGGEVVDSRQFHVIGEDDDSIEEW